MSFAHLTHKIKVCAKSEDAQFSPDGRYFAHPRGWDDDCTAVILDTTDWMTEVAILPCNSYILSMAWHPNMKGLLVATAKELQFWNTAKWTLVCTCVLGFVVSVGWFPDGKLFACGRVNCVFVMQYTMKELLRQPLEDGQEIAQIIVADDAQVIVASMDEQKHDCKLCVYKLVNFNQLEKSWTHEEQGEAITVCPQLLNGHLYAGFGSEISKFRLLDGHRTHYKERGFWAPDCSLRHCDGRPMACCPALIGPNKEYIVCMKQFLYVWKMDKPEPYAMFGGFGLFAVYENGFAVNPKDPCEFVAYSYTGKFWVWRLEIPVPAHMVVREVTDNKATTKAKPKTATRVTKTAATRVTKKAALKAGTRASTRIATKASE